MTFIPSQWASVPDWQRIVATAVNPLLGRPQSVVDLAQYQVSGNGSDETEQMQAAINFGAANGLPVLYPGSISHGALTLPTNTRLIGAPSKTLITPIAGSYDTFTITGSDVTVEGLHVDNSAKSGGYDFHISCGANVIERSRLARLVTFSGFGGIKDSRTTGYHVTTDIDDVKVRGLRGVGFNLTAAFGFIFIQRSTADFVTQSDSNYTGFIIDQSALGSSAGGIYLSHCQVLGTAGTYNNLSQVGFAISNASDINLVKCEADTVAGDGFVVSTVNKLKAFGITASDQGGHGISLTSVTNSDLFDADVNGRNALAWNQASKDGLKFVSGCSNVNVIGGIIRDNTGHGVNKVAAQAGVVTVNNVQCASNTGRGVKTVGASAFRFSDCVTVGNTAGNFDLGDALDRVVTLTLDSGALVEPSIPGPATG